MTIPEALRDLTAAVDSIGATIDQLRAWGVKNNDERMQKAMDARARAETCRAILQAQFTSARHWR